MGEEEVRKLIDQIRQECLAQGLSGIKGLGVLFRGIDYDYSKTLSLHEFVKGMQKYGISLDRNELNNVFCHFDEDHSGRVDFREFLMALRPTMSDCRLQVINEAFDKLDAIKDGQLMVEDLKIVYKDNAMAHPRLKSGELTLDEVLASFLSTFDSPHDPDGVVTRDEWINYYSGVSCTIEDDEYFDLQMRSSWGLPDRHTART